MAESHAREDYIAVFRVSTRQPSANALVSNMLSTSTRLADTRVADTWLTRLWCSRVGHQAMQF
jgi:hypothetical protein